MKHLEQVGVEAFVPSLRYPKRPSRAHWQGRWATEADVLVGGGLLGVFAVLVLQVHSQPFPAGFVVALGWLGARSGWIIGPDLRLDPHHTRPCLWRLLLMAAQLGFLLGGWTGLDMAAAPTPGESVLVFGLWGIVASVVGCCTGMLPLVTVIWGVFFAAARGGQPGWQPDPVASGSYGSEFGFGAEDRELPCW